MHDVDRLAVGLALAQQGVFAAWQLEAAGVPLWFRDQRVRSGAWIRHLPGVYGLPGVPSSYDQRLWIGWLAVGLHAVISFESAAEVHQMPDVVRGLVVLTVSHSGWHRIPGVTVHQISDVLPDHLLVIRGLPVTTVPRTIVDLAAVVHPARLAHIVEDSKHAGLTSYEAVGRCLLSVARRGKPGVRPLSRVIDSLTKHGHTSASRLERATIELLAAARLPLPIAQFPFPGRQFTNGCVDFAYPRAKLIIETDGRSWHTRIKQLKRDHERDHEAARHGWETLRLLYEHVLSDPEGTAATVATVLSQRLTLLLA